MRWRRRWRRGSARSSCAWPRPGRCRPGTASTCRTRVRCADQGEGDLGARMARAVRRVTRRRGRAGRVLLIGTDCPGTDGRGHRARPHAQLARPRRGARARRSMAATRCWACARIARAVPRHGLEHVGGGRRDPAPPGRARPARLARRRRCTTSTSRPIGSICLLDDISLYINVHPSVKRKLCRTTTATSSRARPT